jgi:hypothetical protein
MNKQTTEELGLEKDKIVEGIMKQKAEIIDLFVKTFMVTEVKDLENFRTGMLELVCGTENVGMSMQSTYKCVFIPLDEYEELKGKVVKRKELNKARTEAIRECVEVVEERARSYTPKRFSKHDEIDRVKISDQYAASQQILCDLLHLKSLNQEQDD